ncbi:DUF1896 family protein [Rubrolithibacter danxiaensis]|uniref:DUF1896 family protein n=1 Tax=Rubrolithibacter danxiaensis TaxID=3390805 RepID=UPI003BF91F12
MQTLLIEKLRAYIINNNPDVLIELQLDFSVTQYLEQKVAAIQPFLEALLSENKPAYIVEELCLNALTKDLRPSKFNYIRSLLEEEFKPDFLLMKETGTLTYEIVNLINAGKPVFETLGFTEENEDDRSLYYAIAGTIHQYLKADNKITDTF